jgi:two-component system sensor histidine kinase DesK
MTVREAVTNVQRHAHASRVHVKVRVQDRTLALTVTDNGRGGAIVPGNGLSGMRERLAAVGAELRVDSTRGRGTVVSATLQLPAGEPATQAAGLREA